MCSLFVVLWFSLLSHSVTHWTLEMSSFLQMYLLPQNFTAKTILWFNLEQQCLWSRVTWMPFCWLVLMFKSLTTWKRRCRMLTQSTQTGRVATLGKQELAGASNLSPFVKKEDFRPSKVPLIRQEWSRLQLWFWRFGHKPLFTFLAFIEDFNE